LQRLYQNSALLITGSTASGKSALAIMLAKKLNGVVINADSMQVYKDLRILSARPSEEEEKEVPHRLYGYVDAGVEYSVGHYVRDAAQCLRDVRAEGKTPIFVGGTGLYFKALTQGLIETPLIPPHIRERLYIEREAGVDLHARLMNIDPDTATKFAPANYVRIVRALEVYEATGKTMSEWQRDANSEPLLEHGDWCCIFLHVDREVLKARIHKRFEDMVRAGALDEVRGLMALGLPPNRGIMKAHGVPHLIEHLKGSLTLDEAIELGQIDTRRYAKRQRTFARGQLPEFIFMELEDAVSYLNYDNPNLTTATEQDQLKRGQTSAFF
jgi:tRNA dimethylallyltransferase